MAAAKRGSKTTFANEFLPKEVKCLRFLNADEIARGLSPFDPAASAIKAARLLLEELHENIEQKKTFALESTLSGKTYLHLFQRAKQQGFEIELHYLWLSNPAQAVARVRERVQKGGHNVPIADIRRRFERSVAHLLDGYLTLATRWIVWDSRGLPAKRLAISGEHDIEFVRKLIRV